MVMPLVILAVLSVIWLLTVFYSQTAIRSGVHLALRRSAGIASDTILTQKGAGYSGLYNTAMRSGEVETLLEQQADQAISGEGGAKRGLRFEGNYKSYTVPSVLKLSFARPYGGWGLFAGNLKTEKACWYYNIDEAQWVRNEDFLQERLAAEGNGSKG